MAKQNDKLNFEQPDNELTSIANAERGKLFPRNDFSPSSESYSAQHPDAIADGDEIGRGTAKFLDIYNLEVGTKTDVNQRNSEIKVNRYSQGSPYYVSGSSGKRPMANL